MPRSFLYLNMVDVAQLVRALDCGSRGRGFESHLPPKQNQNPLIKLVAEGEKETPTKTDIISLLT